MKVKKDKHSFIIHLKDPKEIVKREKEEEHSEEEEEEGSLNWSFPSGGADVLSD